MSKKNKKKNEMASARERFITLCSNAKGYTESIKQSLESNTELCDFVVKVFNSMATCAAEITAQKVASEIVDGIIKTLKEDYKANDSYIATFMTALSNRTPLGISHDDMFGINFAEACVLSLMFKNNNFIDAFKQNDGEHKWKSARSSAIYKAISLLRASNEVVTPISVYKTCKELGSIEVIGGSETLTSLAEYDIELPLEAIISILHKEEDMDECEMMTVGEL